MKTMDINLKSLYSRAAAFLLIIAIVHTVDISGEEKNILNKGNGLSLYVNPADKSEKPERLVEVSIGRAVSNEAEYAVAEKETNKSCSFFCK